MPDFTFLADMAQEVPEVPEKSILSRTLFEDAKLKVVLFSFAPGAELSEHTASVPAILHLLRGEAELSFGGEVRQAGPGAWAHMAAQLPHSVRAKTPVTLLLLMLRG